MNTLLHYSVPCHIFYMPLTTISVWLVPYSNPPTIIYPMLCVPPAGVAGIPIFVGLGHCDLFADRAPVDFICGYPTLKRVRESVSPIVRMLQWWSRRWPLWDAPRHQKVASCILSLRVNALPLRMAPMPAARYDLNGGLPTRIRLIIYQVYILYIGVFL